MDVGRSILGLRARGLPEGWREPEGILGTVNWAVPVWGTPRAEGAVWLKQRVHAGTWESLEELERLT